MFREIRAVEDRCGGVILGISGEVLSVLLGRPIETLSQELIDEIWFIAGKHICKMYYRSLKLRKGIG